MSFVADDETPELIDPSEGSLDNPAVSAEVFAALEAAPGDAGRDASGAQVAPAAVKIVAFVGVEFVRSVAGSTAPLADRMNRVHDISQRHAVVAVGAGQDESKRDAGPINQDVSLRARLAAVGRVRADRIAPFLAATDEESTDARDQSISPARLRRSSMWRWTRSHRPTFCQARSRRQQVMPEQPATSKGRRSHGIAVYSTNRMPTNASRASIGGRPPLGRGASGGMSGAISAHNSSGRSFLAMPQSSTQHG